MKKRKFNPINKAKENPKSLRCAINGKCAECINWDGNPDPRWLIGNCNITDCPLWPVRDYQHRMGDPTPPMYRSTYDSDSGE